MTHISIITVCYNAADTIERTLQSVLQQTLTTVQHIIVDGASTDNTLQLVRQYEQQTEQAHNGHDIVVVSQPDKGIYDAMNKGLAMAQGDYVCFLNAGDTLHDCGTLQRIAAAAEEQTGHQQPAVIYGDTLITDDNGAIIGKRHLQTPQSLDSRSFKQGMTVCHQAFYARTDIAKDTPYDLQYRFSADVDWCIRILQKAEKMQAHNINMLQVVAHYLEQGTTTRNHKASLKERFRIMCKHYGLTTTVLQHAKFVLRAIKRKYNKPKQYAINDDIIQRSKGISKKTVNHTARIYK